MSVMPSSQRHNSKPCRPRHMQGTARGCLGLPDASSNFPRSDRPNGSVLQTQTLFFSANLRGALACPRSIDPFLSSTEFLPTLTQIGPTLVFSLSLSVCVCVCVCVCVPSALGVASAFVLQMSQFPSAWPCAPCHSTDPDCQPTENVPSVLQPSPRLAGRPVAVNRQQDLLRDPPFFQNTSPVLSSCYSPSK